MNSNWLKNKVANKLFAYKYVCKQDLALNSPSRVNMPLKQMIKSNLYFSFFIYLFSS